MIKKFSTVYDIAEDIRNTKQSEKKVKELVWNVVADDWNTGVGYVNVFNYNWPVRAMIYRAYKEHKDDFDAFSKKVHSALMCEYWSRSEYEFVASSWPTGINEDEVNRLVEEIERDKKDYPTAINHRVYPRLDNAEKLDVYDQIIMNWDNFINYLWTNKKLICKFKEDYSMWRETHKPVRRRRKSVTEDLENDN